MAETLALISVDEYLHTEYEGGDRDYVDGEILERNVGERDQSVAQKRLIGWFLEHEASHRYFCFPEQRVQIAPERYRVPDVCVYIGAEPQDAVFNTPPFLVIEILSPRDTFHNIQEKLSDYLAFGVPYIRVVDPRSKSATVYTPGTMHPVKDGVLRTANPDIAILLTSLFA